MSYFCNLLQVRSRKNFLLIKPNVEKSEIPKVQLAALLGSARILGNVLDLQG